MEIKYKYLNKIRTIKIKKKRRKFTNKNINYKYIKILK